MNRYFLGLALRARGQEIGIRPRLLLIGEEATGEFTVVSPESSVAGEMETAISAPPPNVARTEETPIVRTGNVPAPPVFAQPESDASFPEVEVPAQPDTAVVPALVELGYEAARFELTEPATWETGIELANRPPEERIPEHVVMGSLPADISTPRVDKETVDHLTERVETLTTQTTRDRETMVQVELAEPLAQSLVNPVAWAAPNPTVPGATIKVTIGKIEVRAASPRPIPGPPKREPAKPNRLRLDDYLRQKGGKG